MNRSSGSEVMSNWRILRTTENNRNPFHFLAISHNQCCRLPTDPARSQHIYWNCAPCSHISLKNSAAQILLTCCTFYTVHIRVWYSWWTMIKYAVVLDHSDINNSIYNQYHLILIILSIQKQTMLLTLNIFSASILT